MAKSKVLEITNELLGEDDKLIQKLKQLGVKVKDRKSQEPEKTTGMSDEKIIKREAEKEVVERRLEPKPIKKELKLLQKSVKEKICAVCNNKINIFGKILSGSCEKCGHEVHFGCGNITILDYSSYVKKKIKHIDGYCKTCANENSEKFGKDRYCKKCNDDISVSASGSISYCSSCKGIFHNKCLITILDHSSYVNKKLNLINGYCQTCANENSEKFGKERYCEKCGHDISVSSSLSCCDQCNQIGHDQCFQDNAESINSDIPYIYPHIHDKESHTYLCKNCLELLKSKVDDVKTKMQYWVKGTKGEYIRDYKTIKTIGHIEYNGTECADPSEVEEKLKLRAIQVGGNGYVGFYYDPHPLRHSIKYVAGHGYKGNPHYGRADITVKWFTGYATAVVVEPYRPKKDVAKTKRTNGIAYS